MIHFIFMSAFTIGSGAENERVQTRLIRLKRNIFTKKSGSKTTFLSSLFLQLTQIYPHILDSIFNTICITQTAFGEQ